MEQNQQLVTIIKNNKMKNKNYGIVFFCSLAFCLPLINIACNHNKTTADSSANLTEKYVKHKVLFKGKTITFSLPKCYYSRKYGEDEMRLSDKARDHGILYFSKENKYDSFSILTYIDSTGMKGEEATDKYMKSLVEWYVFFEPPMVPFIEKKKDSKGHIYYLVMTSGIDSLEREDTLELHDKHLIYSRFDYITYFENEMYLLELETRDKIDKFSYEEKKKIMESIVIEW